VGVVTQVHVREEDPVQLIERVRPGLTPSLRRVADLVLAEPDLVEECSAAELARRAGSSQAAVTRFCQALGLDGYQSLVLEFAREHGRRARDSFLGGSPLGGEIRQGDDAVEVVAVVSSADIRALQETIRSLDHRALERAAQAIARAGRIDVYGVGGSSTMAADAEMRLFSIGCTARSWSEVHAATTSAALLTSADVAIGISDSGSTREVCEPLRTAGQRGATTIALTRDPGSPLAVIADVSLTVTGSSTGFRDGPMASRHSQLLIVDCLYVRVAQLTHGRATAARRLTEHIPLEHVVAGGRARRRRA
jgi:DNA-binding MurR/RpiR family transcriptional regulator